MNTFDQKLKNMAPVILRFGLAFVFIWFGANQLQNPIPWTGLLPEWTTSLPITQIQFVLMNGWFEIIGATLLVIGAYVRIVALILSLHLIGIAYTVGWNAVGIRDIGLAVASLVNGFLGAGGLSIDEMNKPTNI